MNAIRSFAIVAAALLSVTAAHAQTHTMKISSPTVNDLSQEWAREFKAGIEARSGGKIKVEFYPANQLGPIPATVEGTAMGTIEAVVPASGFFIGPDGKVVASLISVDRQLGIGDKQVAMPFAGGQIERRSDGWHLVIDTTKDELQRAQSFEPGK